MKIWIRKTFKYAFVSMLSLPFEQTCTPTLAYVPLALGTSVFTCQGSGHSFVSSLNYLCSQPYSQDTVFPNLSELRR